MKPPRVSIIIPAFHSNDTIVECLHGLKEQTFRDFEVIIVNSSPEAEMHDLVAQTFPDAIFDQATDRLLPHSARNRGARQASGEILVFTDPDCRAHPDWLERMVAATDAGHELVCGAIDLRGGANWFERGVHLCKYSFRLSALRAGYAWIAGTANACCSRAVWNAIGPFDGEHFSGDAQFSWRAAQRGWRPWFEPKAVVEHHFCGTTAALVRERLYRGEDFASARVAFERWSATRAATHIVAFPAVFLVVLARGWRDAITAGWGLTFVETMPLQILGHAAWLIGEVRAYYRVIRFRARSPISERDRWRLSDADGRAGR